MKEDNKGTIVNVSSLAAFNQFAESAMYCSTKRFLVTFSECLAMELSKYGVKVQCLCPGFTRTDFHSKLKMEESKLGNKGIVRWMTADEVVKYSIEKLDKTLKVIVIPGFFNRVIYNLLKFIPKAIYYRVANKGWALME